MDISNAAAVGDGPGPITARVAYLRVLAWACQHSLWTWCAWLGANATMAAWLSSPTASVSVEQWPSI